MKNWHSQLIRSISLIGLSFLLLLISGCAGVAVRVSEGQDAAGKHTCTVSGTIFDRRGVERAADLPAEGFVLEYAGDKCRVNLGNMIRGM